MSLAADGHHQRIKTMTDEKLWLMEAINQWKPSIDGSHQLMKNILQWKTVEWQIDGDYTWISVVMTSKELFVKIYVPILLWYTLKWCWTMIDQLIGTWRWISLVKDGNNQLMDLNSDWLTDDWPIMWNQSDWWMVLIAIDGSHRHWLMRATKWWEPSRLIETDADGW